MPSALISLPADRAIAPADPLQADVGVFFPESSRAFASADIAVRDNQELIYLSDVRWADTTPSLLGAVVHRSPRRAVQAAQRRPSSAPRRDYDLRWRVVDMSVSKGAGPVRIEVQASLMDSAARRMVAQQSFTAEGVPDATTAHARAAALAIAQKVSDVAAFVAKTVVAKPRPGTTLTPVTPAN